MPHIQLPDVPQDATSLPPEALAHIPTLTERVPSAADAKPPVAGDTVPVLELSGDATAASAAIEPTDADAAVETVEDEKTALSDEAIAIREDQLLAEATQEPEVAADTWVQQMQVRMDRLMDDIHTLNDRLDRLENKTKV